MKIEINNSEYEVIAFLNGEIQYCLCSYNTFFIFSNLINIFLNLFFVKKKVTTVSSVSVILIKVRNNCYILYIYNLLHITNKNCY